MRTLWLVVPDHVMQEKPYFRDRLDQYERLSRVYATRAGALAEGARQARVQRWPVHVLEATCIQVFPAEQTTEATE